MMKTTQTSIKDAVLAMIQRLPDECSLEDIQYHMFVMARVEQGLADAEAGEVISQDDVERMVQEWVKSSGPNVPRAS